MGRLGGLRSSFEGKGSILGEAGGGGRQTIVVCGVVLLLLGLCDFGLLVRPCLRKVARWLSDIAFQPLSRPSSLPGNGRPYIGSSGS